MVGCSREMAGRVLKELEEEDLILPTEKPSWCLGLVDLSDCWRVIANTQEKTISPQMNANERK